MSNGATQTSTVADIATPSADQPTSAKAKLGMFFAAVVTIVLYYLFTVASILAIAILLVLELGLVIVLLRFGLAGRMINVMNGHVAPLQVLIRSLWLRSGFECRVKVDREEAPRLYDVVEDLCAKAGVAIPEAIFLEMHTNAWVRLRGYVRGRGKTTLGIGYDLLAGLSEMETQAVLAHEVTHARLVHRGINQLLRSGMARIRQLAGGLAGSISSYRHRQESPALTRGLFKIADWIARTGARQVAACSRQDEFDADHGAAELCGASAMRSALLRLRVLDKALGRLPWRERVAQVQLGESFSEWLTNELATSPEFQGGDSSQRDATAEVENFNAYSTHPTLTDRLRALPAIEGTQQVQSSRGLNLLGNPDELAEKLMIEIQRVTLLAEERDAKQMKRWLRKAKAGTHFTGLQTFGIIVGVVSIIFGGCMWISDAGSTTMTAVVAAVFITSLILVLIGRYRDRIPLPIPDFRVIRKTDEHPLPCGPERVAELNEALKKLIEGVRRARKRARILLEEAYQALANCDYPRAFVAAQLCLKHDKKNIAAHMALAVSSAAVCRPDLTRLALGQAQHTTNLTTPSTSWGAAWALVINGDYGFAEAFLHDAMRGRSNHPTLLAMLAVCQARRGKLYSAIGNARRACTPESPGLEYTKLLVGFLLDGGFSTEASSRLEGLESEIEESNDLKLAMVRLNLMIRKAEAATEWAARLETDDQESIIFARLGAVFESARKFEIAERYFTRALQKDYLPEALIGLGRIEVGRNNKEAARKYFEDALNLKRLPAKGSIGALALAGQVMGWLISLEARVESCRAWIATLNGGTGPEALANCSFFIYAKTKSEAVDYLNRLLMAMQPGYPPPQPGTVGWREAPGEQQPDVPVKPGVQGFFQSNG